MIAAWMATAGTLSAFVQHEGNQQLTEVLLRATMIATTDVPSMSRYPREALAMKSNLQSKNQSLAWGSTPEQTLAHADYGFMV